MWRRKPEMDLDYCNLICNQMDHFVILLTFFFLYPFIAYLPEAGASRLYKDRKLELSFQYQLWTFLMLFYANELESKDNKNVIGSDDAELYILKAIETGFWRCLGKHNCMKLTLKKGILWKLLKINISCFPIGMINNKKRLNSIILHARPSVWHLWLWHNVNLHKW